MIDAAIQQIKDARDMPGIIAAINSLGTGPVFQHISTGQTDDLKPIDVILEVPEFRLPAFLKQVERLTKRAERLGLEPIKAEFMGKARKTIKVGRGSGDPIELSSVRGISGATNAAFVFTAHSYRITGKPPVLNAWRFRASINHSEHSRPIIRSTLPEIPKHYRTATTYCEHCNTNRDRNDVYLLQNSLSGKWMQVGRSCLRLFTQIDDAEKAISEYVNALQFLAEYSDEYDPESEGGYGGAGAAAVDLLPFVRVVAYLTEKYGYTNRQRAETEGLLSTADEAMGAIRSRSDADRRLFDVATKDPGTLTRAQAAIEWAKNLPDDGSDYEHNLKIIAEDGLFNAVREAGYAASLYATFKRTQEQQAQREAVTNEWLDAKQGDKLTGYKLHTVSVRAIEGNYGITYLHVFRDDAGRQFKWFGSKQIDQKQGFPATFTVKGFDEYKGIKQTVITRVSDDNAAKNAKRSGVLAEIITEAQGTGTHDAPDAPAVRVSDTGAAALGGVDGINVIVDSGRTLINLTYDNDPLYLVSAPVNDTIKKLLKKLEKIT